LERAPKLLIHRNPRVSEPTFSDEICHFSGWMPGAIAQAGAYLGANPHVLPYDYLVECEESWTEARKNRSLLPIETLVQRSLLELDPSTVRFYTDLSVFRNWFTDGAAGLFLGSLHAPQLVARGLLDHDATKEAYRVPYFAHPFLEESLERDRKAHRHATLSWAMYLATRAETAMTARDPSFAWRQLSIMRADIVPALKWAFRAGSCNYGATLAVRCNAAGACPAGGAGSSGEPDDIDRESSSGR
jgi:hypothetical protein